MEDTKRFAKLIKESKKIVFFGGAGVSTESGLKDYRSADGIYNTAKNYGMPPEDILSHDCFFDNTELFYRFFRDFFMCDAKPNFAHKALYELEKSGRQVSVVTQNIDGLHQAAGSSRVYELHGTVSKLYCTECGRFYTIDCLNKCENVPKCTCGGIIKPCVTLYGEMLDQNTVNGAIRAISEADLMIIGGTSLAVYPAASFVRYFGGRHTVIINRDITPYDNSATLVFRKPIAEVFKETFEYL